MEEVRPEIHGDEFYADIVDIVAEQEPQTVIDIGASTGMGSTRAIIDGVEAGGLEDYTRVFAIEVWPERYRALEVNVGKLPFVLPVFGSSVHARGMMSEADVTTFLSEHQDFTVAKYGAETVLGWLRVDRMRAEKKEIPCGVLFDIVRDYDINPPGFVLIDGSAFTAAEELKAVYGALCIALDDTMDVKNWANYCKLKNDPNYVLMKDNQKLRNGYAIFRRTGGAS